MESRVPLSSSFVGGEYLCGDRGGEMVTVFLLPGDVGGETIGGIARENRGDNVPGGDVEIGSPHIVGDDDASDENVGEEGGERDCNVAEMLIAIELDREVRGGGVGEDWRAEFEIDEVTDDEESFFLPGTGGGGFPDRVLDERDPFCDLKGLEMNGWMRGREFECTVLGFGTLVSS